MEYKDFLEKKQIRDVDSGFQIDRKKLNPMLFDFQKDIVQWSLRRGRASVFADCGLGKTPIQLEWAKHIYNYTKGNVLILAPLAVSKQTKREGHKFGIKINICKNQSEIKSGINITNYEKLHNFNPDKFSGIVLDESGILKSFSGKIRTQIIESFSNTPYKLACTATPSPNDYMELGNHSEFMGVMTRTEMLSMFFINDAGDTGVWKLKGHAENEYWKWLCSWAVYITKPSDLGYENRDFNLPKLNIHNVILKKEGKPKKGFFHEAAKTLQEQRQVKRETLNQKIDKIKELVNDDSWLIWCNMNNESEGATKAIDGTEIAGRHTDEYKENTMLGFSKDVVKHLITKPSLAGHGMNWQHCSNVIFFGLSHSYEQYYQAIRRCWRFGQKKEVNVYLILSEQEILILQNIKRKEKDAKRMADGMLFHMRDITRKEIKGVKKEIMEYKIKKKETENWTLYLGDSCEVIKNIPDDSIHYSIFSPPFASLFTYSNSDRDMGNCKSESEFMHHFKYLIKELYRVIMPGRLLSFHCMNIPAMKERDGYIGLKDFRGALIKLFQEAGFIFHSEVCIWKDPLIEAVRTKAIGLMYKQVKKDSSRIRQGIPDYLITMRKKGDNPELIKNEEGSIFQYDFIGDRPPKRMDNEKYSHEVWRRYASPVWMDIRQTNTLNFRIAREEQDEKHICPLQLDVIERALFMWTNETDIVLSPFAGIGSEGFTAIKMKRNFIGIELKESYFNSAVKNLRKAERSKINRGLRIEK